MSTSPNTLAIQRRLQRASQYNRWIYETIRPDLGRRILDVGCSLGNITRLYLEDDPELVLGVDVDEVALGELAHNVEASAPLRVLRLDVTRDDLSALAHEHLDTVTCLNVLEHLEDDDGLLRRLAAVVQPRGRVIVLVPAFPWLYGTMDAADHHYRRYRRAEIEQKIVAAGLRVRRSTYFNMLGVAGWYINGVLLRRTLLPSNQLGLFDGIVPLVRAIERRLGPPFGQSLIVVGERE